MMGPSKWEGHTGSKKKKWKESIKLKTSKRTLLSWVEICFPCGNAQYTLNIVYH